jgi:myosin heavy subunit
MERTLVEATREYDEMRLLVRQMEAGLVYAHKDLDEATRTVESERKERSSVLSQRQADMRNAARLEEWIRKRDELRMKLAVELRGDLSKEEESMLRSQLASKEEQTRHLKQATEESQKLVQRMEEAFATLKQVTGVSELHDMVDKFARQRSSLQQLEREVRDVEERLSVEKAEKETLQRDFQELKASGSSLIEVTREMTDKLQTSIVRARLEFKTAKAKADHASATLSSLQQGTRGLLQRLDPFVDLVDGCIVAVTGDDATDCIEALAASEQMMSKMLEIIISADASPSKLPHTNFAHLSEDEGATKDDYSPRTLSSLRTSHRCDDVPTSATNVRVQSRAKLHMSMDDLADTEEGEGEGTDANTSVNEQLLDGDQCGADVALNRGQVKQRSRKDAADHARKAEQALKYVSAQTCFRLSSCIHRYKQLQEKLAVAEPSQRAQLLSQAARRKAQLDGADRLSRGHQIVTLPPGVTLRDDAITKTEAFITRMPVLD